MRAYSVDLRERIIAAVEQGHSMRSVAQRFDVSPASVSRYVQHQQQRQTLAPKKFPGRRQRLDAATVAALIAQVEHKPDQTLSELQEWLTQHYPEVRVSRTTVHRALVRAGLTYKKKRWSLPSVMRTSEPPGATP